MNFVRNSLPIYTRLTPINANSKGYEFMDSISLDSEIIEIHKSCILQLIYDKKIKLGLPSHEFSSEGYVGVYISIKYRTEDNLRYIATIQLINLTKYNKRKFDTLLQNFNEVICEKYAHGKSFYKTMQKNVS